MYILPGWSLTVVTEPATEPLAVSEVKDHIGLGLDDSSPDNIIRGLILAARERVENELNRALVSQTWDLKFDDWPDMDYIIIPKSPLTSVTSVTYKDTSNVSATWATTEYIVDANKEPPRIYLGYGKVYPTTVLYPTSAITLRFTAGYTTIPQSIKQAMLIMCNGMWEHREDMYVGQTATILVETPTVQRLLANYKVYGL